ncbi:MAG: ABC transporter permease [Coriobacteriia bacterium]|nr:ABC transporter permease [Coriobacteriia bacterium]
MTGFSDLMAGAYTVWYRDVLGLLKDRSRVIGTVVMTAIMIIGLGFGLGGLIGKVGASGGGPMGGMSVPGVPFVQFIFPAMLAMTVLTTAMQSTMSMVYDREFGFMRKILVAPVSRTSVALGKVAGGMTIALIQTLLMLLVAPFIGIHFSFDSTLLVLLVLLVLSATVTSLGVLVASRQTSQQGFMLVNMLVMMPIMMLSLGSFLPSFGSGMMASAFRIVSQLNPVTYGIDALRQAMLGAAMPASLVLHSIVLDMLVLCVLFVAFLVPGVRLFAKQD